MSDTDNYSNASSGDAELQELRRELQKSTRAFGTQLAAVVICLVVFNFSVNIFIFKQLSYVQRQENELAGALANYQANNAPQMNKFADELRAFARGNKDFYDSVFSQFPLQATNTATPAGTANVPKPAALKK